MKFRKPIGLGLILVAGQFCALGAEVAVLRNGFSIRFDRKQQSGETTRLFVRGGYVDVATSQIASFEQDDTPDMTDQTAPAAPVPAIENGAAKAVAPAPTIAPAPGYVAPTRPATPAELDQVVREISTRYRLDPDFVSSVIKAESNFQSRAVSRKGAQGLMQLMPATASKLGVKDPFDPKANVEGGTAYLSQLLDMYHDDPIKALAAYNAGAHRVEQYHGIPPYRETLAYVARIVRDFNAKKRAQMKAAAPSSKTAITKTKTNQPGSQPSATAKQGAVPSF